MFILEEPYISDFLIETTNKNNFMVFKNGLTEEKCNNLFDEDNFSDIFNSDKKIYTNSENSFEIIHNKLKNTNISKYISLCKNKTEFRKLLNSVYPDFFFKEFTFEELLNLKKEDLKYPFVIKPSIGFLSIGVYAVYKPEEFEQTMNKLKNSIEKFLKDVKEDSKTIHRRVRCKSNTPPAEVLPSALPLPKSTPTIIKSEVPPISIATS